MVMSSAPTVEKYLASLAPETRREIDAVRTVIRKHLGRGYEECMAFGMIGYVVPRTRLAETYNGQPLMYAALAAQKNFNSVYLMGVYSDESRGKKFAEAFARAGKKLDIGKSCIRFKRAEDLALDAIGDSIASLSVDDYVALYEKSRLLTKAGRKKAAKTTAARKATRP
jgi:hypothetical protein